MEDTSIDPDITRQSHFFQEQAYHFTNIDPDDVHGTTTAVDVATVAIMNFDQNNSKIHSQTPVQLGNMNSNQTSATSEESLNFLQNALKMDNDDEEEVEEDLVGSENTNTNDSNSDHSDSSSPSVTIIEPKQKLVRDSHSKVSMVMVNPASKEGSNRLGRPRRSCTNATVQQKKNSGQHSSLNNLNQSIISTFRIDSLPVSGPGSRGGRKKKFGVEKSRIRSNRVQELLKSIEPEVIVISDSDEEINEDESKVDKKNSTVSSLEENATDIDRTIAESLKKPEFKSTEKITTNSKTNSISFGSKVSKSAPSSVSGKKMVQRVLNFTKISVPKPASIPTQKLDASQEITNQSTTSKISEKKDTSSNDFSTTSFASSIRQNAPEKQTTTKISLSKIQKFEKMSKNSTRKEIPGPLSPFETTTTEQQHFDLSQVSDPEFSKLAFGYPVKYSPYASDLIYILAFYAKFKDLFTNVGNIGILDLSEGLNLDSTSKNLENDEINVNLRDSNIDLNCEQNTTTPVSKIVKRLFNQLLLLLLNKTSSKPKTNQIELVAMIQEFGIPSKWRAEPETMKYEEDYNDPVDLNMCEFMDLCNWTYQIPTFNQNFPLKNKQFFEYGLDALEPEDRLLLLKSVCSWALAHSLKVKAKFVEVSNLYDSAPLETYYIPKMFKYLESEFILLENKTKRFGRGDNMTDLDHESDVMADPLWFRTVPFLIGGGIDFCGNFHFVKLQDYHLSFKTFNDHTNIVKKQMKTRSSGFKLYVEDFVNNEWFEICDDLQTLNKFKEYIQSKIDNNVRFKPLQILCSNLTKFSNIIDNVEGTKRFQEVARGFQDFAYNNQNLIIERSDEGRTTRSHRKLVDYKEDSASSSEDDDESVDV